MTDEGRRGERGLFLFKHLHVWRQGLQQNTVMTRGQSSRRKMHIFSKCLFEGELSSLNELNRPPAQSET